MSNEDYPEYQTANKHEHSLMSGVKVMAVYCSCGKRFQRTVDESNRDASYQEAYAQAMRAWLFHLEEMKIRGLVLPL